MLPAGPPPRTPTSDFRLPTYAPTASRHTTVTRPRTGPSRCSESQSGHSSPPHTHHAPVTGLPRGNGICVGAAAGSRRPRGRQASGVQLRFSALNSRSSGLGKLVAGAPVVPDSGFWIPEDGTGRFSRAESRGGDRDRDRDGYRNDEAASSCPSTSQLRGVLGRCERRRIARGTRVCAAPRRQPPHHGHGGRESVWRVGGSPGHRVRGKAGRWPMAARMSGVGRRTSARPGGSPGRRRPGAGRGLGVGPPCSGRGMGRRAGNGFGGALR